MLTSAIKPQPSEYWKAACAFSLAVLLSGSALAVEVQSVSNDVFEHQGEDAYWQATVQCEGSSLSIPIKQVLKQTRWCSENSALPCAESKLRMAEQVCLNIEVFAPARPAAPTPSSPTSTATLNSSTTTTTSATQREVDRQTRQQEQEKAQALAELDAEDRLLQQQRRQLEADRRALSQLERELDQAERQLEAQLRTLEN